MAKRIDLLRWVVSGALCLASCGSQEQPAGAQVQVQIPLPPALPTANVADLTRHYANLLARNAQLATPASRRYKDIAAIPDTDTSFSLMLKPCEVLALLDRQQRLVDVSILPHRAPEDPNRLVLEVPQPAAHLVRLGELRQVFGPGAALAPPFDRLFHYRFAYHPTPSSHPVTIEAFMPGPTYVDSARAEHLILYLTPPK